MTYKEAYNQLIQPERLEALRAFFVQEELYDPSVIQHIQMAQHKDLNYLWTPVESTTFSSFIAMSDLTYVNVSSLLPSWEGLFCMPLVYISKRSGYLLEKWMPYDIGLEHELLHIRQVMHRADKDPDYFSRSRRFCLDGASQSDLQECVRYEMEKIFLMELEAQARDWDLGQRYLVGATSAGDGLVFARCRNKSQFLNYTMSNYLRMLFEKLVKKFPGKTKDVEAAYRLECQRLGKDFFGPDAAVKIAISAMQAMLMLADERSIEKLSLKDIG